MCKVWPQNKKQFMRDCPGQTETIEDSIHNCLFII